jgi:uncharacterized protein YecE (DUF72 family)
MINIGTCSWTDPTLVKESSFYPAKSMSAEERLRFYATRFNTVEVDSSFYALPAESVVALQVKRTPPDFTLHYKAYGMLTKHFVNTQALPKSLRESLPPNKADLPRLSADDVSDDMLELAFRMFRSALRPAQDAGKLGCCLFQFPPWFRYCRENLEYIDRCQSSLPGLYLSIEFRHPDWLADSNAQAVFDFLDSRGLSYVSVDEPQFDRPCTVPPVFRSTGRFAYVRLHGRNKDAWFAKGVTAAERFAYNYTQDELFDLAKKIKPLERSADRTFVMFNNCFRDYAVNNAMIMDEIFRY